MFRNIKACKRLVALLLPLFLISVLVFEPSSRAQRSGCPGNLLQNGDFATGVVAVGGGNFPPSTVPNWSTAFGTPQITTAMGCGNAGFIKMWGNKVVGEGIRQTVNIQQGHTYRLSACVRVDTSNPILPKYVRFNVRAATWPIAYTATAPAAPTIGIIGDPTNTPSVPSPGITSTTWTPITLANWTAPANFNTLTINPENDNTANDGNTVSWGWIDNVCLQEVPPGSELFQCESCRDLQTKTDLASFSHVGGGVYNVTPVLSVNQANIIRVTANVISSSLTYSPSVCGTAGPVNSYVVSASNAGSLLWSVPVPGGHEVIWHGSPTNLSGVSFPMQIKFPPPPTNFKCRDALSFCVKYTFTTRDCRTCEVIRCYGPIKRGGPIKSEDISNINLTP
jgi:hypothetical protein